MQIQRCLYQEAGSVATHQDLSSCKVGDLILFHNAGAYGATLSSNSNSRSLIPRVLVDGNELRLIWRRQTIQALMVLV